MDITYEMPEIIALDDWMVWGRDDATGRIVETCAEMWSEWLDEPKLPEDMETEEYRKAVLRILRHKRPAWRDTFEQDMDDDTRAMIADDLVSLERAQAAFIAANL